MIAIFFSRPLRLTTNSFAILKYLSPEMPADEAVTCLPLLSRKVISTVPGQLAVGRQTLWPASCKKCEAAKRRSHQTRRRESREVRIRLQRLISWNWRNEDWTMLEKLCRPSRGCCRVSRARSRPRINWLLPLRDSGLNSSTENLSTARGACAV